MLWSKVCSFVHDPSHVPVIVRAYLRYCCRLADANEIRGLIKKLPLSIHERETIFQVKDDLLDFSTYRNELYHSIWLLLQQERPYFRATARRHKHDSAELKRLYGMLSPAERKVVQQVQEPVFFDHSSILAVTQAKSVQRIIRSVTYHQLRFLYKNDGGHTKEDFHAELGCWAIKVIRNYEVGNLTVAEMIPLAVRGIINRANNIVSFYGHEIRNCVTRVKVRNDKKTLWYCDVDSDSVFCLKVFTEQEYRNTEGILAEYEDESGTLRRHYVYQRRLYETKSEAEQAMHDYRTGGTAQRSVLVDLTSDTQDDWRANLVSHSQPINRISRTSESSTPLIEFLPSNECSYETMRMLFEDLSRRNALEPDAHLFMLAILGDLGPMFESYVQKSTGRSSAELSSLALGRAARRYCGMNLKALTEKMPRLQNY